MITAFPPILLLCIDAKYPRPMAFLQEDALQLHIDQLAREHPDAAWEQHDFWDDDLVRGRRIEAEGDGLTAQYRGQTRDGRTIIAVVEQIDRLGAAVIRELKEVV